MFCPFVYVSDCAPIERLNTSAAESANVSANKIFNVLIIAVMCLSEVDGAGGIAGPADGPARAGHYDYFS